LNPPENLTHCSLLPHTKPRLTLTLSDNVLDNLGREMLEVHEPEVKIVRELHIIYAGVDPLNQRTSHFILLGDVYRCRGLFSQAKVVSSHLWVEDYL
jgi:hypothetical protein